MLESRDLRFFAVIARQCSLAAAARALDVSPPAVSQRLAQIETRLGLKLVERGAGILRLTAEGELLSRRAMEIITDIDELVEDLATCRGSVSGLLRVVAPFGFGRAHVAPVMASLSAIHPALELDLKLTEDPRGTLQRDYWDILIHVGRLSDAAVTQRKLADNRRLLCAAPEYITRHPQLAHPYDLVDLACGVVREDRADATLWFLTGAGGETEAVRVRPCFSSNDGEVIRMWALAGLGIVERSEWSVADDLRAGRLIEILQDWQLENADVVALVSPHALRTARTEACIKALSQALSPPPWRTCIVST